MVTTEAYKIHEELEIIHHRLSVGGIELAEVKRRLRRRKELLVRARMLQVRLEADLELIEACLAHGKED